MAGEAAERIAAVVRDGGHIALSGGSTPRAAHERVAAMEGLDWSRTHLWFGDERAVPPDNEHSNYRMAVESLIDRIEGAAPQVHRDPRRGWVPRGRRRLRARARRGPSAKATRRRSTSCCWASAPTPTPPPCSPAPRSSRERERWAVGVETPGMAPLVSRVTLTLPVLNAAREIVFLISGEDKAEAVARAFGDYPAGPEAPASLVDPVDGSLTVLLDAPAASRLEDDE